MVSDFGCGKFIVTQLHQLHMKSFHFI
jgi:hypothetical protein